MSKGKSSISKANSYEEIAEFWDTHSLSDYWDQLEPVEFEFDIQSIKICYDIDEKLSKIIRMNSKRRGISAETLLNLWLQEELQRDQIVPFEFEADILLQEIYYDVDHELSDKIDAVADKWNMSANMLANLWLWRKVKRDQLDVIPESNVKLAKRQYPVDTELSDKIRYIAKKHGISANTLVNLMLQNEIQKERREIDKTIIVGVYGTNKDII
jgi:hypothetical protein